MTDCGQKTCPSCGTQDCSIQGGTVFEELRKLEHDWDSHGAVPIDRACIKKALDLAHILPDKWYVLPVSDGSVQLEQHVDGFDIEIWISHK